MNAGKTKDDSVHTADSSWEEYCTISVQRLVELMTPRLRWLLLAVGNGSEFGRRPTGVLFTVHSIVEEYPGHPRLYLCVDDVIP